MNFIKILLGILFFLFKISIIHILSPIVTILFQDSLRFFVSKFYFHFNKSILYLQIRHGRSIELKTRWKGCNESKAGICRSIWAPGQIHSRGCVSTRRTDVKVGVYRRRRFDAIDIMNQECFSWANKQSAHYVQSIHVSINLLCFIPIFFDEFDFWNWWIFRVTQTASTRDRKRKSCRF